MRKAAILAGLLALLLAAFWFKGGLVEPARVPEQAAPGAFDTKRAMARLARVLGPQRPHPVDSAEADAVRARLIAELAALGIPARVTDDVTCIGWRRSRGLSCARIRNVVATVGPASGPAAMMVSHYDSTPVGPGAGDDGIGMAVMLEAAALLRERPLKRPVILLFNEGEEAGLIGARAFLDRDPLAAQVDSVVNLEARGVTGPAVMFETSRPNASAIGAYGSVPAPSANSLTVDFYERLPNDTDVSVFKERPWTILNFAIVGNETRYHTPGDDLAALDPRSVRHMGEQAVAATLRLIERGGATTAGDRLYTDVLGGFLLSMPKAVGIGLLGALLLLFAWLAWTRRGGVARGAAATAVAIVDAGITAFLGQWLVGLFRDGEWWRAHPETVGFAVEVGAVAAGIASLLVIARPVARDRLRIGFWLAFLLIGAVLTAMAPGAVIFFLAPPLIAGAAMLARRWERPAALLAALLLFLSWAPLLHLSGVLMDMDAAWLFAPVALLVAAPFLIELMPLMRRLPRGALVAAAAGASVLAWMGAALAPAYSEDRKQHFGIEYVWDEAGGRSRWMVVNDGAPLPSGFRGFEDGVEVPFGRRRWAADAPRQPVEPPALEKVSERAVSGGRVLTLRLRSNGAGNVAVRFEADAGLRGARAGGPMRPFGPGAEKEPYFLRCHGRSCDGLTLEVATAKAGPLQATVIGSRPGLPAAARPLLEARPRTAQPQYSPDATIAYDKVTL